MSCSPFDLKDYFLGELQPEDRAAVEKHVADCPRCREELQSLDLTRAALLSLPEEEPPRRIAFVSDKVFEPSWWHKLWHSGPQLGFAAAAMLSLALVVHAFVPGAVHPTPAAPVAATEAVTPAGVEAMIEAEVARRVDVAVRKAVQASEYEQVTKLLDVVNARLNQNDRKYGKALVLIEDMEQWAELVAKQQAMIRRAAYDGAMQ
jgi:anti-sigma factor RsiW